VGNIPWISESNLLFKFRLDYISSAQHSSPEAEHSHDASDLSKHRCVNCSRRGMMRPNCPRTVSVHLWDIKNMTPKLVFDPIFHLIITLIIYVRWRPAQKRHHYEKLHAPWLLAEPIYYMSRISGLQQQIPSANQCGELLFCNVCYGGPYDRCSSKHRSTW
jgi:hypothetical protein